MYRNSGFPVCLLLTKTQELGLTSFRRTTACALPDPEGTPPPWTPEEVILAGPKVGGIPSRSPLSPALALRTDSPPCRPQGLMSHMHLIDEADLGPNWDLFWMFSKVDEMVVEVRARGASQEEADRRRSAGAVSP